MVVRGADYIATETGKKHNIKICVHVVGGNVPRDSFLLKLALPEANYRAMPI